MNTDLKLADSLNRSSAYDHQCKNILSNKQVLATILKGCIAEYKDLSIEEITRCIEKKPLVNYSNHHDTIEGKNVEDASIVGALIRYDVLFDAVLPKNKNEEIGVIINIEAQNKDDPSYPLISRALYYCARLISRQKNAPDGFQKSEFDKLKKVYSIWLCTRHKQEKDDVMNQYKVVETCMNKEWHARYDTYDLFEAIMVYPAKEYNYRKKGLMEFTNLLFNSIMEKEEKMYYLVKDYDIRMTRELDEEMNKMCNLSEGIKEDALKEGIEKGRIKERINSAKEHINNLMESLNVTFEEAIVLLKINEELVKIIREEMNEIKA